MAPAGTDTRFLYDGTRLIAEYNGAGTLLRRYVHEAGVDQPLVWYEGAGTSDKRRLYADERGSVIAVEAAGGVTRNTYDAYGVPGAGNAGRFQYTGQAWLPEVSLYHYKARAYAPLLGRFMQTDPIGYADQMNLYAYVGNDPVNAVDPSGLERKDHETRSNAIEYAVEHAVKGTRDQNSETTKSELRTDTRASFDGMESHAGEDERYGNHDSRYVGGVTKTNWLTRWQHGKFRNVQSRSMPSRQFITPGQTGKGGQVGDVVISTVLIQDDFGRTGEESFENLVSSVSDQAQELADVTGSVAIMTVRNSSPRWGYSRTFTFTPDKE